MQTKVQVCVPDPDGVFPEYEGPFMWQAQKRAIREAEREKKRSQ